MAERTRKQLLKLLAKCSPRTRRTVMRVVEGKVSQDNAAFIQEQLSFIEPDMTARQVDFVSSRTCSFGHLQDQQVRLVGVCEVCGAFTCSAPGCSFTCGRCGKAVCRGHARVYGETESYCSHCARVVWLRELVLGRRS